MRDPLVQQITVHPDLMPCTYEALSAIQSGRIRSGYIQRVLEAHFLAKMSPADAVPPDGPRRGGRPLTAAPPHKLNLEVDDSEFQQTFAGYFDQA